MFRSNVPAIAEFCFRNVDPDFVARARRRARGVIVGGEIYGQGSSREAAVLSPLHLGRARGARQELRPHPPRQPDQLGHRAARVRRSRRTTTPSSATTCSTSTSLRERARGGQPRRGDERGAPGARFRTRCDADAARARHPAGRRPPRPDRRHPEGQGRVRAIQWPSSRIRAVYMRGGTSRCLVFHERDLPPAGPERDRILLAALGSPDPYGRQLDGLGGGISSLSKACIIGAAHAPGRRRGLHLRAGRGEPGRRGLHRQLRQLLLGGRALRHRRAPRAVRRRRDGWCASTTPTRRRSSWRACRWRTARPRCAATSSCPAWPGAGARIALDFLEPGGAGTGRLLPTGRAARHHRGRRGLAGGRHQPDGLRPRQGPRAHRHRDAAGHGRRQGAGRRGSRRIRVGAAEAMGIPGSAATPKIAVVAPPTGFTALDGAAYDAEQTDVVARVHLDGQLPPRLRADRRPCAWRWPRASTARW